MNTNWNRCHISICRDKMKNEVILHLVATNWKGGRFWIYRYRLKNEIIFQFVDSLHEKIWKTSRFFNFHLLQQIENLIKIRNWRQFYNFIFLRQFEDWMAEIYTDRKAHVYFGHSIFNLSRKKWKLKNYLEFLIFIQF